MNTALFMLSIFLPTTAGYLLFYREDAMLFFEKVIFSFSVGTGLLSFYLFGLGLMGTPFSSAAAAAFFVPFLVVGIWRGGAVAKSMRFSLKSPLSGLSPGSKIIFSLLLTLILWKLFYLLFIILSSPTAFWDAYTLWNYKAKVIYHTREVAMGLGGEGLPGDPYKHYPLHLPIMRAWTAFIIGEWNDSFVNLHSFVTFLCLLGLVYITLRRELGKIPALVFTYFLSSIPVLGYNVMGGYADMAVGHYFLAAVVMLYYWRRTKEIRFLFFSGILSATAMFTKNEGSAIVFPAVFITFLFYLYLERPSLKFILGSLVSFLAFLSLIFLWFTKSGAFSAIVEISEFGKGLFHFHSEGLKPLFKHLFIFRNYHLYWAGIILLVAFRWKKAVLSEARLFFVPAMLSLAAVLYVFLFTSNVKWLVNGTTINRTMCIVVPILTVASGFLVGSEKSEGPDFHTDRGPADIIKSARKRKTK